MIVYHQNGGIVIADSVFALTGYGRKKQAYIVDNLPFFKAHGSNVLIAGVGRNANADLDLLRYEHLPFPSELSVGAIGEKIHPRVRKLLARLGRLDEDGEPETTFIFAKGDKAYALDPDGTICPIEEDDAFGMNRDMFRAALAMTKDLPPRERIVNVFGTVGNYMGIDLFPIIAIESKKMKPFVIGGEE